MTSFDARLRLPGETAAPLGVEVDLTGERMRVTVGRNHIANWALRDISVSPRNGEFHIKANDEEVILDLSDQTRFAREIGLHSRGRVG